MLSFGKIIVLLLVVVLVLFGMRLIGVIKGTNAAAKTPAKAPEQPRAPSAAPGAGTKAADLINCPKCGTYTDAACDRQDCPLAR